MNTNIVRNTARLTITTLALTLAVACGGLEPEEKLELWNEVVQQEQKKDVSKAITPIGAGCMDAGYCDADDQQSRWVNRACSLCGDRPYEGKPVCVVEAMPIWIPFIGGDVKVWCCPKGVKCNQFD